MQTSNTPLANSLEFADGIAKIFGADGSRLMYNTDETASGKKLLFRYYQNADNAILVAPQLYRYIGSETAIYNVELTGIYSENGRILGAENLQIFTVSGIDVTHENGRLSGIYIVKSGEKIAKIAVK